MKKNKYKLIFKIQYAVFITVLMLTSFCWDLNGLLALESNKKDISRHSYVTADWNKTINQQEIIVNKYPDKRKITPETVRLTINEYYIPQFSELLEKGVDYFEWLNKLDDPYLNRYKVDVRVDPDDERLKLFWKRSF